MYRVAPGVVALVLISANVAWSADDPTGTWKWTAMIGNQPRETTAKLKLEGDKLTGTVSMGKQEQAIDNGTCKEGDIAFTVSVDRNGQKFSSKYSGKLSGDTIKGKMDIEFNGQSRSLDWEAKRAK